MIKILTCNLGRSKAAHALIERTAAELQASIIICPEPNKKIVSNGNWFIDERKDTAIRVINKDIRVLNTIKGCGYVQIELLNIVIYEWYISPNIPLEDFATYLASLKIAFLYRGKKLYSLGISTPSPGFGDRMQKIDEVTCLSIGWRVISCWS